MTIDRNKGAPSSPLRLTDGASGDDGEATTKAVGDVTGDDSAEERAGGEDGDDE